ncbi:SCP2 domain-containing protein [Halomonas sp.]|jgi:ubiquinone biosynthesis protein UbiJ|uniref:ubiquinone biosynthesis accessory factor UbiJ n=1 Tax=Halomonas sp. TaxID=1486246 RepID=UPI0035677613
MSLRLAAIERPLNALLARDPASASRLARLAGHRILLRLESPRLVMEMHFHPEGIELCYPDAGVEEDHDAVVEIDAETAGALLGGASIERLIFQGKLKTRGRTPLLQEVQDLLLDLHPDWEGELANWLGDAPANDLAERLRASARWGRRARDELAADLSEFVFEEARWLPGRHQASVVRDHLTELEIDTDRLQARVERIERRLSLSGGQA